MCQSMGFGPIDWAQGKDGETLAASGGRVAGRKRGDTFEPLVTSSSPAFQPAIAGIRPISAPSARSAMEPRPERVQRI